MIDKYHAAAQEKRVRIVPMCGFDSIPADLGSLMVVDHLRSMGKACRYVRGFVVFKGSARYTHSRTLALAHRATFRRRSLACVL